jgi:glycosyltransferase involved in cell wall biosynthesis
MIQQFDKAKNFQVNEKVNEKIESPYRVVLVHPSAGLNWSGGSEIFAIEMTRRLSAYFEVELLSGDVCTPCCYPIKTIARTKAKSIVDNSLLAPLLRRFSTHPEVAIEYLTSFFPSAARLLRCPADLIFPCNDYGGLIMAAFIRALKGTPILFTEHHGLIAEGSLLKRNLRFRPDRLVVFSEEIADFAHDLQPAQSVSIIPNGVNLELFTPKGKSQDFGLTGVVVLCVASLKRGSYKRVESVIEAVSHLPQASLLLCGDGSDRDYFQVLGNQVLGANRFAIVTVTHEQMPEIYRSADIFTLPSLNEPFGLSYLEAMACGLPVVAPDDPMRRYLVNDGGILCDVTDIDIYAQAIADAINRDWGDQPRENSLRFSWDAIAIQYRDLILGTINKSRVKQS